MLSSRQGGDLDLIINREEESSNSDYDDIFASFRSDLNTVNTSRRPKRARQSVYNVDNSDNDLDIIHVSTTVRNPRPEVKKRKVPEYKPALPFYKDTVLIDLTDDDHGTRKGVLHKSRNSPSSPQLSIPKDLDSLSNEQIATTLVKALKCPICQFPIQDISSTKCGHLFCQSCIEQAVRLYKKCPTCRKHVFLKDVHRIFF